MPNLKHQSFRSSLAWELFQSNRIPFREQTLRASICLPYRFAILCSTPMAQVEGTLQTTDIQRKPQRSEKDDLVSPRVWDGQEGSKWSGPGTDK